LRRAKKIICPALLKTLSIQDVPERVGTAPYGHISSGRNATALLLTIFNASFFAFNTVVRSSKMGRAEILFSECTAIVFRISVLQRITRWKKAEDVVTMLEIVWIKKNISWHQKINLTNLFSSLNSPATLNRKSS
jgi:hypothetical protein